MTGTAFAFAGATAIGAALTCVMRSLARRLGIMDHALVSRKIHGRPVPRMGGVAIVLAFYASLGALLLLNRAASLQLTGHGREVLALAIGGLLIAALGTYDDALGAGAREKLIVQFGVAALAYWAGFRIDHVAIPSAPVIDLGWFGVPFTLLWIVGVINAINLIDGLDGLAGGVAFVAAFTLLVTASANGDALAGLLAAALAGSVLGFLFFNFHPASIFMGDTGSMFLGFILATAAIHTNRGDSSAVAILVPIISLALPIADTLLAMGRRVARGVPMFRGDRGHIHHRLLDRGLSHRDTVLVLYGASVVLACTALLVSFAAQALWFVVALVGACYFLLRKLGFLNLDDAHALMKQRRRNMVMQGVVRRAGEAVRDAESLDDVWKQVRRVGRVLGATCVGMAIGGDDGEATTWSEGLDEAPLDLLRARYGLNPERPGASYVEFGWSDGRTSVDRDSEIAIELLCHHLTGAVEVLGDARVARRGGVRVLRFGG